jgi:tetratricopeptide (TPR) repeat protein
MEGMTQVYTAGFTPAIARDIARRTKAETYISGSFQGRENTFWILVNLVNTETGNILWTNKIVGDLKSSGYLVLADSLCNEVKNYLEIKALSETASYDFREVYPKSAEAYRYFIEGMDMIMKQNYPAGYQSINRALEIDSTFALASFFLAYTCNIGHYKGAMTYQWLEKAMLYKDRIPSKYRLWLEMWNSCNYKNYKDIKWYCDQMAESGIDTRLFWADLGITYCDFLHEYSKAVNAFENVIRLNQELGQDFKFGLFWDRYLEALHKTGAHQREKEISEIGLQNLPEETSWFYWYNALCPLSLSDTSEANKNIKIFLAFNKTNGTAEYLVELWLGDMYRDANLFDQAEPHYRKAVELAPLRDVNQAWLAKFLIYHDRNVTEGIALIQNYLEKYPKHIFALNICGWGYYKQGNYERALEYLNKALENEKGFQMELYEHLEVVKNAIAANK